VNEKVIASLKTRYNKYHPLLFHRSLERAKTEGELFDILDSIPEKFPIIWDEQQSRWVTTPDLFRCDERVFGKE